MNELRDWLLRMERRGVRVPEPEMIKSREQIDKIRESGKVNTAVLDFLASYVAPGITTGELDRLAYEETIRLGGRPAPLGFEGYPKSICTSVDAQVCHGIPKDSVVLLEGNIVNLDVSTYYQGYYADSSRTFLVGEVSREKKRLVREARNAMLAGIEQVRPFAYLGDVASAVWAHARKNGYQIASRIGGHGIGLEFHEKPFVPFVGRKGHGMLLVPGMVFTIEPVVNMGSGEVYQDGENGWTIYTRDGKPSAQWEVTVVVTSTGHEILSY